jgi:hypothetical protein
MICAVAAAWSGDGRHARAVTPSRRLSLGVTLACAGAVVALAVERVVALAAAPPTHFD